MLACAGCELAQAQPRPRGRRDAGVMARDAGVMVRPPTRGRIDPGAVGPVVAGARAAVQRCYEQALARDPTARGELEVRLRVEENGRVSESAARTAEPSLRGAARCIEGVLGALVFPRPTGGAATLVVPYRFAAGE